MSESLRNRLIGVAVFLPGLAWMIVSPDFSEGVEILGAFLAGAALAAGLVLIVTGDNAWSSAD